MGGILFAHFARFLRPRGARGPWTPTGPWPCSNSETKRGLKCYRSTQAQVWLTDFIYC